MELLGIGWLAWASDTKKRLSQYAREIDKEWGLLPTQLLPANKYPTDRPFSRAALKDMAKLATVVDAQEAQKILLGSRV